MKLLTKTEATQLAKKLSDRMGKATAVRSIGGKHSKRYFIALASDSGYAALGALVEIFGDVTV